MSEITERAERYVARKSDSIVLSNAADIMSGLLTGITQLRADLKMVSVAIMEAHKENCTLYGGRDCCFVENGCDYCYLVSSSDYLKCKHYKPCECPACKIAGEASA